MARRDKEDLEGPAYLGHLLLIGLLNFVIYLFSGIGIGLSENFDGWQEDVVKGWSALWLFVPSGVAVAGAGLTRGRPDEHLLWTITRLVAYAGVGVVALLMLGLLNA